MSQVSARADVAKLVSHRGRTVPPSGIRRFFEIAATMEDVISLGIGEPDFVSPQPVIEAAIRSLRQGKTGYTANAGLMALRELISGELQRLDLDDLVRRLEAGADGDAAASAGADAPVPPK